MTSRTDKLKADYIAPAMEIAAMPQTNVICTSDTGMNVSDPWSGNTEVEW